MQSEERDGGTMLVPDLEKKVNGFYIKNKKHKGTTIGIQNPHNKKAITYIYDESTGRHIGKLVNVLENGQFDI